MGKNQKKENNRKDVGFTNINFSAEWDEGEGRAGVHASPAGLVWWYCPGGSGGRFGEVGAQQTFEELFTQGPLGVPVPEKVMRELRAAIEAHGIEIPRLPKPPTANQVLDKQRSKTDPDSIAEREEIERYVNWLNQHETDQS
jgi:hypothetical protein